MTMRGRGSALAPSLRGAPGSGAPGSGAPGSFDSGNSDATGSGRSSGARGAVGAPVLAGSRRSVSTACATSGRGSAALPAPAGFSERSGGPAAQARSNAVEAIRRVRTSRSRVGANEPGKQTAGGPPEPPARRLPPRGRHLRDGTYPIVGGPGSAEGPCPEPEPWNGPSAAFYQLAAVTSVTDRELLANADELQLPLIGVSTSLSGFFFLSCVLVVALVVHLYGQLLLLAGLVGDFVHEHPDVMPRRDQLYPGAPLHVMMWWAASRSLARRKRGPGDESTFDIALRIAYLFSLALFTTVAFTAALGVTLWEFRNSGDTAGRAFMAACLALTFAAGLGAMLEAHCRLRRISEKATSKLVRVGIPCLLAAAAAWSASFAVSAKQDLRRADLSGLDLGRHDFSGADLRYADLTAARLRRADFERARRDHATRTLARLPRANLRRASLRSADLRGAILRHANLDRTNMSEARLDWADFTRAKIVCGRWREASGESVDFSRATFSGCPPATGLPPPSPSVTLVVEGDRTTRRPLEQGDCEADHREIACLWLQSGTQLETVPSWLRERLPTVPSPRDARRCRPADEEDEDKDA